MTAQEILKKNKPIYVWCKAIWSGGAYFKVSRSSFKESAGSNSFEVEEREDGLYLDGIS